MVKYVKSIDKDSDNRTEFLLCDYPYFDGNDLLAKIFMNQFGVQIGEKIDGMYYTIIKAYKDQMEYVFLWHEDVGNSVYCVPQSKQTNERLEHELSTAIDVLNSMLKK